MLVHPLRLVLSAVLSGIVVSGLVGALPAHADPPAVLYVDNTAGSNCSDAGSGTKVQPFCTVQPAADLVLPGQTVTITGEHFETVSVTRSGTEAAPIIFDGENPNRSSIQGVPGSTPTVTIADAHDITFRNLRIFGGFTGGGAVVINGSSRITVDGNHLLTGSDTTVPTIHATGGSTFVTISRNKIGQSFAGALRVDPGGSNVTVAANDISDVANGGITVAATPDTAITGNTILRSCNAAVSVTGQSPGSSVQNNIIGYVLDPERSSFRCPAAPVVTGLVVDAAAAPGMTVAHNIVYPFFGHLPYLWAGTSYASASELITATGQGRRDLNVEPGVRLDSFSPILTEGSPAIDSADADAPGQVGDDRIGLPRVDDPLVPDTGAGAVSYHDRGAFEWQDSFTRAEFSVSATQAPVGGQITVHGDLADAWSLPFTCEIDYGDGTTASVSPCSATHAYPALGTYTIHILAANAAHLSTEFTAPITIVPAGGSFTPGITATQSGARGADIVASAGTDPWNITTTVFDFGDGTPQQTVRGTSVFHVFRPGTYTIRATITDAAGNTGSTTTTFTPAGSAYVAHGPTRLLDTRTGLGIGGTPHKVAPRGTLRLAVGGTGSIPAGITAVAMNITVTNPRASGFITAYPDGATRPLASSLNFTAGQTVPNMTVLPVGANGFVDLFNGSPGTVDLIADISGYFVSGQGDRYSTLPPVRLLDTRDGTGTGGVIAPVGARQTLPLTVAGAAGGQLPATGITAVALNVTATGPAGPGFLTAYPDGSARPVASNLNYVGGQTIANVVIVPVGANGNVNFYSSNTTDLVADVAGYFSATGSGYFVPIIPTRQVDTRNGTGQQGGPAPLPAMSDRSFDLTRDLPRLPEFGIMAMVLNATVTNPTHNGVLTIHVNSGEPVPTTFNLNFTAGSTVPNLAITPIVHGRTGVVPQIFRNDSDGTIDLVLDVSGYFAIR